MSRKNILLIILLVSLIFVSGCWDYTEYENLAQVIGIAVDFDNKSRQTTVTHQYLISESSKATTSSGPSSSKSGIIYSATDKTLYDALSDLQQVVLQKLFYGYLKVFILGEDAAKYNLLDQVELMDRTPLIRDTAYFFVCSGKAEKVLSTVNERNITTSSEYIADLINNSKATGAAFPITIHDVTEMLAIDGWEVAIPRVISTAQDSGKPETIGSQDNIRFDEKNKGALRVSGMAAFKGDKFIGWLNEKETTGFGWITGKPLTAYKVSDKPTGTDPSKILYFHIIKSGGKMKSKLVNGEPVIFVEVSATAELRKYYSQMGTDYLAPGEIKMMEQVLTDSIRSDIQAALTRGQGELRSDIFGFGFAFFRKYPYLWKSEYAKIWPDIYPDIPVHVTVKTKVINTGNNIRKLIMK
jgi:spore germination protein KC